MIVPSYFNIVYPVQRGSIVFNLAKRRVRRFAVPWTDIVDAAGRDPELDRYLSAEGLFFRSGDYLGQVAEYLQLAEQADNNELVAYLCVTTECSVGCSYCFQANNRRQDADPRTIARFLTLLDRRLSEAPRIPRLYLILFGGEPILRRDLCLELLVGAQEVCRRHDVVLQSYLAANGVHETPDTLDELHKAGLFGVCVTFDGPREIHERYRPGTYETLIRHLPYYASAFRLSLKYNLTRLSAASDAMVEFLDDLVRVGVPAGTLIMPEPVVPVPGDNDAMVYQRKDVELVDRFIEFVQQARRRNMGVSLASAFRPPCFLRRRNVMEIQPDGHVLMCEEAHGIDRFYRGNLHTMDELTPDKRDVVEAIVRGAKKKCADVLCPYFPMCETGCFLVKHYAQAPFDEPDCHYEYFDRFFASFPATFESVFSRKGFEP